MIKITSTNIQVIKGWAILEPLSASPIIQQSTPIREQSINAITAEIPAKAFKLSKITWQHSRWT